MISGQHSLEARVERAAQRQIMPAVQQRNVTCSIGTRSAFREKHGLLLHKALNRP